MLVPDYEIPRALMVPHGNFTIRQTLESIAEEASKYIGVILLSGDPEQSRAFVEQCSFQENFSIVAAPFDTPWIRDRSPFTVAEDGGYRWVVPNSHMEERQQDSRLFNTITNRTMVTMDLILPQGNLVAGGDGLAISTDRILVDNHFNEPGDLVPFREQLGIRDWLLIQSLESDSIGHADCYVRFLSPELMVLAHDPDETVLTKTMEVLGSEVRNLFPVMNLLTLPVSLKGGMLESPLNWIQLDRLLLVPLYPGTTVSARENIKKTLEEQSYQVVFISSPTTQFGGALHCLTASVFQ